jgi:hypothetical protein
MYYNGCLFRQVFKKIIHIKMAIFEIAISYVKVPALSVQRY